MNQLDGMFYFYRDVRHYVLHHTVLATGIERTLNDLLRRGMYAEVARPLGYAMHVELMMLLKNNF